MTERLERLQFALQEIVDWAEGKPADIVLTHFPEMDVKGIRRRTGMSQEKFAHTFGINVCTLRHWERGDSRPSGAARSLLQIVAKAPEAALKALEESRKEAMHNAVVERPGFSAGKSHALPTGHANSPAKQ